MLPMKRSRDLWDPFDFVRELQDEMGRFLSTLPAGRNGGDFGWRRIFEPDIEIKEENDHFLVRADLPGIRREDLDLTVTGNLLTLKGERKGETESKGKNYAYSERFYGAFSRTLELPTEVDANQVKATYRDGVLELVLPKTENEKPKQIKVEVK
jgi:HSP20 family protein